MPADVCRLKCCSRFYEQGQQFFEAFLGRNTELIAAYLSFLPWPRGAWVVFGFKLISYQMIVVVFLQWQNITGFRGQKEIF